MIRNGLEVAHSIAERIEAERWYRGQKWTLLVKYAQQRGQEELVNLCTDNVHKGLLEWRLYTDAAQEALEHLPSERVLQIRYGELMANPNHICDKIETFINIAQSEEMRRFADETIIRRSKKRHYSTMPPSMQQIVGTSLVKQDS